MYEYGASIDVEWSVETLIFYSLVVFSVYFCATNLKDVALKFKEKKVVIPLGIISASAILICVKGFSVCGRDLVSGYYRNFLTAESLDTIADQTTEIGYRILNVLVYRFSTNYQVFIFIVALLTILPLAFIANKYKHKVDIGIMFFLYATFFFFPGFSALRSCLAASFGFLAIVFVYEKKVFKALFWFVIAISIHISVLALVLPIVLFVFFRRFDRKIIFIGLILLFVMVFLTRDTWSSIFVGRYQNYSVFEDIRIGYEEFLYYLPFFILVYNMKKSEPKGDFLRFSLIYLLSGLFFGVLGYIVLIFGRIQEVFIAVVLICGYYCKKSEDMDYYFSKIIKLFVVFYGYARFFYFIVMNYDQIDIMPYVNIFGWICN